MNQIADKLLEILFLLMLTQMIVVAIFLRVNNISVSGTAPINPILFKLAKIAMFICWLAIYVQAGGLFRLSVWPNSLFLRLNAALLFLEGFIIQCIAYFNLGKNLKYGIPNEEEKQKATLNQSGLYRLSRNPMYLGFFLITLAACLYITNPIVWLLSIFTIRVHHCIVLREEQFLKQTFGEKWLDYQKKVRRYL